ncbi:MAG: tetratricopeptide repeat protein [Polyangiales bacterium]
MTKTLHVMWVLSMGLSFGACAHGAGMRAGGDAQRDPTADEFVQIAEGAERMGDGLRAQQYLNAALRAGADEREIMPRLLRLYVADGQYRVAIEQCEHYLRRQPDDREVRLLMSTLHTAVGENESAIRQYEQLIASAPRDAYAHYALATLLHEQGGASLRADEHFRAYLAIEPRGEHAVEARGLLLKGVP